ncbi:MAG: HIT domain-containing protein [Gammaproteobacteria bacterium]|nr:HIT domain-containing protein [Gammaproteobacteria bacterium]
MFELDQRLNNDTLTLGHFALCDVLLMNDARYPWVILVPRRQGITEIHQLDVSDQQQLMTESSFVASKLAAMVHADKMNVAALGNVVSQLHIHHVARFKIDQTWPAPVWGRGTAVPYSEQEQQAVIYQLQHAFIELMNNGDNNNTL